MGLRESINKARIVAILSAATVFGKTHVEEPKAERGSDVLSPDYVTDPHKVDISESVSNPKFMDNPSEINKEGENYKEEMRYNFDELWASRCTESIKNKCDTCSKREFCPRGTYARGAISIEELLKILTGQEYGFYDATYQFEPGQPAQKQPPVRHLNPEEAARYQAEIDHSPHSDMYNEFSQKDFATSMRKAIARQFPNYR